jgi:hypothetical protein
MITGKNNIIINSKIRRIKTLVEKNGINNDTCRYFGWLNIRQSIWKGEAPHRLFNCIMQEPKLIKWSMQRSSRRQPPI